MNLHRRVAALEKWLISAPTVLVMPDGTSATLPGHGLYLVKLFESAVSGANLSAQQTANLELIRKSTNSIEPGGGRIVDLIRCFLHGPAQEGE